MKQGKNNYIAAKLKEVIEEALKDNKYLGNEEVSDGLKKGKLPFIAQRNSNNKTVVNACVAMISAERTIEEVVATESENA